MTEARRRPYSDHRPITDPVQMRVEGNLPSWLNGNLVRVGPGLFKFGQYEALFPMDGMGLLHSFQIQDGKVTFISRLIESDIYKKNIAENRFTAAEFGTPASPNPAQKGMFARLKEKVSQSGELSDNCNHNLCFWKENNALLVVGNPMFVIDPNTLETVGKVVLPQSLGIDLITEHVHFDKDGTMYLLGSHVRGRPVYHIVKVPATGDLMDSFQRAEIIFSIPGQFKVTPTSHHNFVMTDNFFVMIECPMEINILKILTKGTVLEAINWDPSTTCKFHVLCRKTGKELKCKMESEAMLFLHSSNAYEEDEHIIMDAFIMSKLKSHKDVFTQRNVLASEAYEKEESWKKYEQSAVRFIIPTNEEAISTKSIGENAVTMADKGAEAIVQKSKLLLKCRSLVAPRDVVEYLQYPAINPALSSKKYTYFYAGGYGESDFLKFGIGKYNVDSQEVIAWEAKTWQYLSEPVFIADPEGTAEDDGLLLFTMLDYAEKNDRLVVVDARSMSTIAQVFFDVQSGGAVLLPEADHGVFIQS
ncbi:retinal Mueller cells isomerohydrolase-like [Watersipora subatra]|uniref:retinal Mueller cells isomerohydrolase-like n=1 Tax=Watersipora subatra TaxID=2589382 RepID=UPI00355C2FB7